MYRFYLIFAAYIGLCFEGSSTTLYVDFNSKSHSNFIADGSIERPFSDLYSVLSKMASIEGDNEEVEIVFRGGRYELKSPVIIDINNLTNFSKVSFKSYKDERVIFTGSNTISGWEKVSGNKNLVRIKLNLENVSVVFANENFAMRSRYPNFDNSSTFGRYLRSKGIDSTKKGFYIQKELFHNKEFDFEHGVQLVYLSHWQHYRISSLNQEEILNNILVIPQYTDLFDFFNKSPEFYKNSYYYLENSFAFLDSENEWFYDVETGYLYYFINDNEELSNIVIEVATLDTLFYINGDKDKISPNIYFENLIFEGTGWGDLVNKGGAFTQFAQPYANITSLEQNYTPGLFYIKNASNISFIKNTFRKIGGSALKIHSNTDNLTIIENQFYDIGANAIEIDSIKKFNPPEHIQSSNTIISNNIITRTGRVISNGGAILLHYVNNAIIENNTICDLPYSGIQIGNQPSGYKNTGTYNNSIKRNHIFNVMQLHDDGGAIYTLGGNQKNTVISRNYIHDIYRSQWAGDWYIDGIYLDNFTQFVTAQENVIVNSDIGGERNKSRNNIFKNNGSSIKNRLEIIEDAGASLSFIRRTGLCKINHLQ